MARSSKPLILIAEDNPDDVQMLKRAFSQAGIRAIIRVASDGEQAISILERCAADATKSTSRLPDFLFLDLKMPRKDGFDVIRWIRKHHALADLPIVVLTSSDEIRDVNLAYTLGANTFLTKPLDFTEFRNTIYSAYNFWVSKTRRPSIQSQGS
jgi:CheY-like chemotaxis protein